MAKLCYLCNKKMDVWRQSLSKLKMNHSKTTISSLLRRLLRDFQSQREVDDNSNCICVECFDEINEYDWLTETAKTKEKELRKLLLTTEMLFVNKIRLEACVAGNSEVLSIDKAPQETVGLKIEIIIDESGTISKAPANASFSVIEAPEFDESLVEMLHKEESEDEKVQVHDVLYEETQNDGAQIDGIFSVLKEIEHESQNEDESIEGDLEIEDTMKMEWDKVENGEPENVSDADLENTSLDEKSVSNDTLKATTVPKVLEVNSSRLAELTKQIQVMREKERKPPNVDSIPRNIIMRKPNNVDPISQTNTKHIRRIPSECEICKDGKFFPSKAEYQLHIRQHRKTCDICDITFPRINAFRAHMKWHDRFPGFACRVCLHKLVDKETYKKHTELHTRAVSKTQCVICEKIFPRLHLLRIHMTTHKEPELMCDLCGKFFRREKTLADHRKTHLDIRPEKCIYCPKAFKTVNLLTTHMRTHTQTNRPYACSICPMKFKLKDHMKRHERRHTENTKTIKCTLCKSAFEHKFFLKQHMQRKHGVEIPHEHPQPPPSSVQ